MTKSRAQLRLLVVAVWGIFAIILTTQSTRIPLVQLMAVTIASTEFGDAVGHAGLFAVLTLVAFLALNIRLTRYHALWLAMIITLLLGTATEISQLMVADRSASLSDRLANYLGVFLVGFFVASLNPSVHKAVQS